MQIPNDRHTGWVHAASEVPVERYNKPLPVPDEATVGFRAHALQDRLAFQRCQHCGKYAHPPVPFCRGCHDLDDPSFRFEPVSGRGTVTTWTIIGAVPMVAGFENEPPWVNVLVELDEQRDPDLFLATLVDGPSASLAIGVPVEVTFKHVTPHVSLPYFKLTSTKGITP